MVGAYPSKSFHAKARSRLLGIPFHANFRSSASDTTSASRHRWNWTSLQLGFGGDGSFGRRLPTDTAGVFDDDDAAAAAAICHES